MKGSEATYPFVPVRSADMIDPSQLGDAVATFLSEYHLATLTTLRRDGSPHVVAVGFSYEPATQTARVITFAEFGQGPQRRPRRARCAVPGGWRRWLTLEGVVSLVTDAERVGRAVDGYAARYRQPGERAGSGRD